MITDELINGLIPAELAAKSVAAEEVARFTRRSIPLTAMLIAAARRDNFKNDYEGWMQWCADRMGVIKADKRCHLDNIGRMLLMIQQTRHQGVFRLLFEMDSEKLLAITRLVKGTAATAEDVAEVISFANRFRSDLQEMSRERIRLYVKQWLRLAQADGEVEFAEATEKPAQMMLPGFERSIELFRDLTPETASSMVKSGDVADKAGYAGYLLVNSYVNYAHAHDGFARVKDLTILKSRLLDLIDRIDALDPADDDAPEIAACGNKDPENEAESGFEEEQNNNEVYAKSIAAAAKEGSKKVKKTAGAESEEAGRKNMTADAESERAAWTPEVLTPDDRRKITEQMGYDFDIGSVIGSE